MPRKKGFKMRRFPQKAALDTKGTGSDLVSCMCADNMVKPLTVGSKHLRLVGKGDSKTKWCTVAAVMRQGVSSFCTWNSSVLDSICEQGKKLMVEKLGKGIEGQYEVFDTLCSLSVGKEIRGECVDSKLHEALQVVLLEHGSCLLDMSGYYCAIVHHNNYFVLLDFNACNGSGLPSDFGQCVMIAHSSFWEMHIMNLSQALNAVMFSVVSVNVVNHSSLPSVSTGEDIADKDRKCASSEVKGVVTSVPKGVGLKNCSVVLERLKIEVDCESNVPEIASVQNTQRDYVRCVQGSFHQGDSHFGDNAGRQCVAMSLAAMVMHKRNSVMTWTFQQVDDVVVSGDNLYTFLSTKQMISDQSNNRYLLINDLPKQCTFRGCQYKLEYSQPVAGDLHVEEGEFVSAGLAYRLSDGLEKIFATYEQCFFTFDDRTCAIFCQDGKYVVFDSHARNTSGMTSGSGKSMFCTIPHLLVYVT